MGLRALVFNVMQEIKNLECDTLEYSSDFSAADQVIIAETLVLSVFDYKPKNSAKYPKLIGIPFENQIRCEAQNWARTMGGMPANLCTPSAFCDLSIEWIKKWDLDAKVTYQ